MAEQNLWQRMLAAVTGEYERRIRRASLVTEYGVDHHADHHAESSHAESSHDDDEAAAIVNVPKGTRVGRHAHPAASSEHDHTA